MNPGVLQSLLFNLVQDRLELLVVYRSSLRHSLLILKPENIKFIDIDLELYCKTVSIADFKRLQRTTKVKLD